MWVVPIAVVALVVLGVVVGGYLQGRWTWDGTGFNNASLWDWLDLLVVPAVLGIGGIWFQRAQKNRELKSQREQRQIELELEDLRRERVLNTENQRAQDFALQSYLDQMGRLLLDRDLRHSEFDDPISIFARALTLTTLGRVEAKRKRSLIQFLVEAGLVNTGRATRPVSLSGADLRHAALADMKLFSIDLGGADLRDADLSNARLSALTTRNGAVLTNSSKYHSLSDLIPAETADLTEADLRGAILKDADLPYVHLSKAKLKDADVRGADLRETKGLTQQQIDVALGDDKTLLPTSLQRPTSWSDSMNKQSSSGQNKL